MNDIAATDERAAGPSSAFDDIERAVAEPADHLISRFDYLNASGRHEAAKVRALIDGWLRDYSRRGLGLREGRSCGDRRA